MEGELMMFKNRLIIILESPPKKQDEKINYGSEQKCGNQASALISWL